MMTVHQVSQKTGVSVRTLHYYDEIGLLPPIQVTEAGYRLYDDSSLERLQHILLYRELQFSLKDIQVILNSPDFDRNRALEQQIRLLEMRKEHLENLILLARGIHGTGVKTMNFDAFDTQKIDEYAAQAKASWGKTDAYKEFEHKQKGRTRAEDAQIANGLMQVLAGFHDLMDCPVEDAAVQEQVKQLQAYITANYYTCTPQILSSLGQMYAGGGTMTENIDRFGGEGTAEYAARAIAAYCGKK